MHRRFEKKVIKLKCSQFLDMYRKLNVKMKYFIGTRNIIVTLVSEILVQSTHRGRFYVQNQKNEIFFHFKLRYRETRVCKFVKYI